MSLSSIIRSASYAITSCLIVQTDSGFAFSNLLTVIMDYHLPFFSLISGERRYFIAILLIDDQGIEIAGNAHSMFLLSGFLPGAATECAGNEPASPSGIFSSVKTFPFLIRAGGTESNLTGADEVSVHMQPAPHEFPAIYPWFPAAIHYLREYQRPLAYMPDGRFNFGSEFIDQHSGPFCVIPHSDARVVHPLSQDMLDQAHADTLSKKTPGSPKLSFGSPAIFIPKDPLLSAPFFRRVWFYRENFSARRTPCRPGSYYNFEPFLIKISHIQGWLSIINLCLSESLYLRIMLL
jgi:hypothetical protein